MVPSLLFLLHAASKEEQEDLHHFFAGIVAKVNA